MMKMIRSELITARTPTQIYWMMLISAKEGGCRHSPSSVYFISMLLLSSMLLESLVLTFIPAAGLVDRRPSTSSGVVFDILLLINSKVI